MDLTPNPPWVDRVLNKHWRELEAKVGAAMMPVGEIPAGKRKATYKEYGCGHYGCVMPTSTDDVVCKVTSDVSERDFVRTCMEQGWEWPEGIVQYHSLAVLDDSHLKRPVAVLWRQEAVGDSAGTMGNTRGPFGQKNDNVRREESHTREMLILFRDVASAVRDKFNRHPEWVHGAVAASVSWPAQGYWAPTWEQLESIANRYDRPPRTRDIPRSDIDNIVGGRRGQHAVEALLQTLLLIVVWMENESATSQPIGDALGFYLSKGILLADVHLNNVGLIYPRSYESKTPHWAIIDPGHAVFLGAPLEW